MLVDEQGELYSYGSTLVARSEYATSTSAEPSTI